ncbi:MAG: peptidoglycan D,D-transpeptidase FtsI family protein [Wujia sp.]
MRKKKKESDNRISMEDEEFLKKEKEKARNNKKKNIPILVTTYMMVFVFVGLIGYVIYFMQFKAETVIANSRNIRQDSFSDVVERGDIITSDGVVIAESVTDEEGNTTRNYPYKNMFAHVVGYDGYGRAGLELQGNFYMLRSHVNLLERLYNEINETKNRGDNLVTTINFDLQKAAYDALGNNKGAVIAIEPSTGKILAMVSKPDYDPNNIDSLWEYLQTDEGSESTVLLNRATQGLYTPGSTFKVVTLLEYIRENPTTYDRYAYTCNGSSVFANVEINCPNKIAHGTQTLKDTLAYSCNNSFSNISTSFDLTSYHNTAEELLFNSELPYSGGYSKSSFVIDEDSRPEEVVVTAFGQGDTQITPLHNALISCAIANGGVLMKPYLIEKIENDDGVTVKKFKSSEYGSLLTPEEAEIMTEYMKTVCDYGTASKSFANAPYDMAGKTGTAEYDNEGNCNSWFVGFSNPDDPDLVVCAIVENSDNISNVSGTWVAKQVFDAYYNIDK